MARTTRLTRELIQTIVERVRIGNFPYIAAQAVGIPKSTFYHWMAVGSDPGAPDLFRELRDRVLASAAEARSSAEARVFRENPLAWLRLGPGRGDWTEEPTSPISRGEGVFDQCPKPMVISQLELETAYHEMLRELARGAVGSYSDQLAVTATAANRTPEQFESDVLKVCGPKVFKDMFGTDEPGDPEE